MSYTSARFGPYSCAWLLTAVFFLVGCGGNPAVFSGAPGPSDGKTGSASAAKVQHVVVVVEENHSYSEVIGNSSMPFLNGLASKYGLATNYFGNVHPSLPNYFELTAGDPITMDDNYAGTSTANNIARVLTAAGKTWKVYAEDLPKIGYTGEDKYPYIKHHNPFVYFSSVLNDPSQLQNIVPFSQFAADLAAGTLPNYAFIVPNMLDDAHDGSLADADNWLSTNIGPLVKNAIFAQTLMVVTFDESVLSDIRYGGGHVATVIAGGTVKPGYQSAALFQHESTLRLSLDALGVGGAPGAAAAAPSMQEFLQ